MRRTLPWRLIGSVGLAALALLYVSWGLDWGAFVAALRGVNLAYFAASMAGFTVLMLLGDVFALRTVLAQSIRQLRFSDVLVVRGASYLPSLVNYHLGHAWLTWFLSKKHGAPVWRVLGSTLLGYASIFGALTVFAALSWALQPARFPWLFPLLLSLFALSLVYLAALRFGRRLLERLPPTRVLCEAGIMGHLFALLVRLPHVFVLFLGTWVPFLLFGIEVPFSDALALVPILLLVTALPLTPQGVGTREVVAIELFSRYVPGTQPEASATITACCLAWVVLLTLLEVFVSLVLMPFAHRIMPKGVSAEDVAAA